MDLPLFSRVLWRFKWLVVLGVVVATALAFLSVFRIDTENGFGVEYRQNEQWVSVATVLVTEGDFPLGRAALQQDVPPANSDEPGKYTPQFAPSSRFIELANVYAELVTGDAVRQLILEDGPLPGVIQAVPLVAANGSDAALPMVAVRGLSTSPEKAVVVAQRASAAFQKYLETEQASWRHPARAARRSERGAAPVAPDGSHARRTLEDDSDRRLPDRDARLHRARVHPREPPSARAARLGHGRSGSHRPGPQLGLSHERRPHRERRARPLHLVRGRPRGARTPGRDRPHGDAPGRGGARHRARHPRSRSRTGRCSPGTRSSRCSSSSSCSSRSSATCCRDRCRSSSSRTACWSRSWSPAGSPRSSSIRPCACERPASSFRSP